MGKKKSINYLVIGVLVLFILTAAAYFGGFKFAAVGEECQDVFCNDYEFVCCGEEAIDPATIELGDTTYFECQSNRCVVLSASAPSGYTYMGFKIGSQNCGVRNLLGLVDYIACDDDASYQSTPVTFYKGQVLHSYDQRQVITQVQTYEERLVWCGDAACDAGQTGIPVQGADGCTFVTEERVYNEDGTLNQDPEGSQISKTVPTGTCYLAVKGRHVCGNSCEDCDTNADCAEGHTLVVDGQGAECLTGQLQIYGCRDYGNAPSHSIIDIFPWESSPIIEYGKRCEIISSRSVQCCPYTDSCGQGTCDPSTFTCEGGGEVECTADWQCGQAEYCDRDTLELVRPECNLVGKCVNNKVSDVDCCYDYDCPEGWYCDEGYECKESINPKVNCPPTFDCCVNEDDYYDKPCPPEQECSDHNCIEPSTPDECMAECNSMSDWNPMKQLCGLKCSLLDMMAKISPVFMWGLVGIFAATTIAIIYPAINKKRKRR